ncbi:MAG: YbaK/EbsC family protein [Bacilli bacterium]|jgi:prolyl-tRNA editing enzyme YbaK/EbsC (Cys-tRNA(Pro) deacylase)|nr:YbaK/EbsC family protein [Bacilli bacterium]
MNKAIEFLKNNGFENDIITVDTAHSAIEAAQALNVELKQISKSLVFKTNDLPVLVLMSGDAKIDSSKFRKTFKIKSKMVDDEQLVACTGYERGGVCPFDLDLSKIKIYFDESIKRNEVIYPGAGDSNHLVKISLKDIERITPYLDYIDIGKNYE